MKRLVIWLIVALGWCVPTLFTCAQQGKNLSDDQIAKLLIGTWRFQSGPKDPPSKVTMTFAKDNQTTTEGESRDLKGVRHEVKGSGTWKVDKGDIVTKIEKSTNPKEVGKTDRTRVVSVDGSTLKIIVTFTPDPPLKEFKETFEFKKVK